MALEGFAARRRGRRGRGARGELPGQRPVATHVPNGDRSRARGRHRRALRSPTPQTRAPVTLADGTETELDHGHVVIAAITSCTNTSNPSVMLGAGILARNAVQRGLKVKPWVKTSLAPGSKVVTEYLDRAGLTEYLEALGFHLVGYGCTTCIGNCGPLPGGDLRRVNAEDLAVVTRALSGNRNFEGRINPDVKMNYLASPPLVSPTRSPGRWTSTSTTSRSARTTHGEPVFLKDIWPSAAEVARDGRGGGALGHVPQELRRGVRRRRALELARGPDGRQLRVGRRLDLRAPAAVLRRTCRASRQPSTDIEGARVLAVLGDSVTTDHISPAGSIKRDSPAGKYLIEHGVQPKDFNSYGSRRGNHEVMMRGTFANIRLRNLLAPGTEGGVTLHLPDERADDDLRRRDALHRGGSAAGRARGQGVRLGIVTRLGGEGHAAARRARRDRRELRAHPPLEPRRDGRAAAAVQGRATRSSRSG